MTILFLGRVFLDFTRSKASANFTKLNLFPNPATNMLTVKNNKQIGQLFIKNMSGQTVLTQRINTSNTTIDISELASGVYTVNLNNSVQKLVKK